MILFPNAKINIGLRILRKRSDGYHDIESIFVPVPWCDILEIVPSSGREGHFTVSGSEELGQGQVADNLVIKAIKALEDYLGYTLPPLDIILDKHIPTGAGLGGGSADASFALRGVNELLALGLNNDQLAQVAAKVGADCPFFIYNRPMLVTGIGDVMEPVDVPALDNLWIAAAKIPGTEVSTREAYAGVRPAELPEGIRLDTAVVDDPARWIQLGLTNDFEESVMAKQVKIEELKSVFTADNECIYTAMSGSGSTVYGLYLNGDSALKASEKVTELFPNADIFCSKLSSDGVK